MMSEGGSVGVGRSAKTVADRDQTAIARAIAEQLVLTLPDVALFWSSDGSPTNLERSLLPPRPLPHLDVVVDVVVVELADGRFLAASQVRARPLCHRASERGVVFRLQMLRHSLRQMAGNANVRS